MFIIKILFVAGLSVSIASFAASETDNPEASTNQNQQTETSQPASSTTDRNSASSQQTETDEKKPSMADYCRKHTC